MHDSKGFECLLDEKDEGVKIGIVRVNSDYTSHNTLIGELIIVKAERKGKKITTFEK